jgi:hypothetical protein
MWEACLAPAHRTPRPEPLTARLASFFPSEPGPPSFPSSPRNLTRLLVLLATLATKPPVPFIHPQPGPISLSHSIAALQLKLLLPASRPNHSCCFVRLDHRHCFVCTDTPPPSPLACLETSIALLHSSSLPPPKPH